MCHIVVVVLLLLFLLLLVIIIINIIIIIIIIIINGIIIIIIVFQVFSEKPVTNTSTGGCVNFITAAGGLLQSIIFGYGGIRLEPKRLLVHPSKIPNTTGHSLIGIHYKSTTLNFHYDSTTDTVAMDVRKLKDVHVVIRLEGFTNSTEIAENDVFVYKNQKTSIEVFDVTSPTSVTSNPSSTGSTFFAFDTNMANVFAVFILMYFV